MAGEWNSADKHANVTLSESDIRASCSTTSNGFAVRTVAAANIAASVGRYAEFECVSLGDYCMVGLAIGSAPLNIMHSEPDTDVCLHYSAGDYYPPASSFGSSWTTGDVIMFAFRNGKVYVGKNGTWFNSADFVAETGFMKSGLTGTWYLAASFYTASIRVHATAGSFAYSPPSGFQAFVSTGGGTLTKTLLDDALSPLVSETFDWAFFEQTTVAALGAPVDVGTDTTDGSGVLTMALVNTALTSGQVGGLLISNTAGSDTAQCRSHFAPIVIP